MKTLLYLLTRKILSAECVVWLTMSRQSHVDTDIGSGGIPSARWSEIIVLDIPELSSRSVGFR